VAIRDQQFIYHLTSIENVPSIMRRGLLPRAHLQAGFTDIADPEIIEGRRDEGLEHVPVAALLGIVCYNEALKGRVDKEVQQRRLNLPVYARPGWYF
jgi:hypothetical protein